jgi:hypothetical protein
MKALFQEYSRILLMLRDVDEFEDVVFQGMYPRTYWK